jgi:hypothetical protein
MNTLLCPVGVGLFVVIVYRGWQQPSFPRVIGLLLLLTNGGLVANWCHALRYIYRIRELFQVGYFSAAQEGSPLDAVLEVAAGAINHLLFFVLSTIIILLLMIGHSLNLLGRL